MARWVSLPRRISKYFAQILLRCRRITVRNIRIFLRNALAASGIAQGIGDVLDHRRALVFFGELLCRLGDLGGRVVLSGSATEGLAATIQPLSSAPLMGFFTAFALPPPEPLKWSRGALRPSRSVFGM